MASSDFSSWDFGDIIKNTFINGLVFIPGPGPILYALASIFWPSNKDDAWKLFMEEISRLIDERILVAIKGLLAGDIAHAQTRIRTVSELLSSAEGSQEARSAYNNLAEDLDGLHEKFMAFSDEVNHQILPLLSLTTLMQISFWIFGVENRTKIGLSDTDVAKLRGLISKTTVRVDLHISILYEKTLKKALEESTALTVANNVMSAHGYYRLHGLEYVELWGGIIKNESISKEVPIKIISYSTFFGQQSARARAQALKPESMIPPPFKPKMSDQGIFSKITSVTGLEVRIGGLPRVGGIQIYFDTGEHYTVGGGTAVSSIDIRDSEIISVDVWGDGAVDKMTLTLRDGRTLSVGEIGSYNHKKLYAGSSHAIAGLYLSNDVSSLANQAANIAVSYRLSHL